MIQIDIPMPESCSQCPCHDYDDVICFGLMESWDDIAFHFIIDQWLLDGKPYARFYGCVLKRKEYSIDWRAWNKKPTIEQMKDVKWNG